MKNNILKVNRLNFKTTIASFGLCAVLFSCGCSDSSQNSDMEKTNSSGQINVSGTQVQNINEAINNANNENLKNNQDQDEGQKSKNISNPQEQDIPPLLPPLLESEQKNEIESKLKEGQNSQELQAPEDLKDNGTQVQGTQEGDQDEASGEVIEEEGISEDDVTPKEAEEAQKNISQTGAILYKKCSGCHGINGQTKAMNKSAPIGGQDVQKSLVALSGYKDGSYGGEMKALMRGQVANLSDQDIVILAQYIATLK